MLEKTAPKAPMCPVELECDGRGLFHYTSLFFWNVGFALSELVNDEALHLEIFVGPVTAVSRSIRSHAQQKRRQNQNWPSKFHRINVSNIPDYVGMLSIFKDVMPLLHRSTPKLDTFLKARILLNSCVWDDYAQYIQSSTAIPTLHDVKRLLGLELRSKNSCWVQNYWTWSECSEGACATRDELTTWLRNLYVNVVTPPERNACNKVHKAYPCTVASFVGMCDFLVQVLQYPAHWIVSILDDILKGKARKFSVISPMSVTPPNNDMNKHGHRKQQNVKISPKEEKLSLDLSAFSMELETQLALWICRNGSSKLNTVKLPSRIVDSNVNPVNCYVLEAEFQSLASLSTGNFNIKCLGIVLEPTLASSSAVMDGFMEHFAHVMKTEAPLSRSGVVIRDQILRQGDRSFHVFSCIRFENIYWKNSDTQRVTFWMPASLFDKYKSYYVSLIRTDSWRRINRPGLVVQLRDARQLA